MSNLLLDGKRILIYDTEVFAENFCFVWMDVEAETFLIYDSAKPDQLDDLLNVIDRLEDTVLVGWNSVGMGARAGYDDLMFSYFLSHVVEGKAPNPAEMKKLNDEIIIDKLHNQYTYAPLRSMRESWAFSIDL
jgi:hypothetical protein